MTVPCLQSVSLLVSSFGLVLILSLLPVCALSLLLTEFPFRVLPVSVSL